MHHPPLRAKLYLQFGEGADEIVRVFREEVASIEAAGGPTRADLHRLAGTVGLMGDLGLAQHLRLASQAKQDGRQVDVVRLMDRTRRLCSAVA